MKYIIILIAILAIGCKEEPSLPAQEETVDCYCGQVEGWGGSWTTDGRQLTWRYKITTTVRTLLGCYYEHPY